MRAGSWLLMAATALAAMAWSLPAAAFRSDWDNADVTWSGPGYYVVDSLASVDAGPFSDKASCDASINANIRPSARDNFMCLYFDHDFNAPDAGKN